MADPARHHTVRSLATAWGVSTTTIYQLLARGSLGHIRIGSAIRIRREDVAAYEAAQWHAPAEIAPTSPLPVEAQAMRSDGSRTGASIAFLAGQKANRKLGAS